MRTMNNRGLNRLGRNPFERAKKISKGENSPHKIKAEDTSASLCSISRIAVSVCAGAYVLSVLAAKRTVAHINSLNFIKPLR